MPSTLVFSTNAKQVNPDNRLAVPYYSQWREIAKYPALNIKINILEQQERPPSFGFYRNQVAISSPKALYHKEVFSCPGRQSGAMTSSQSAHRSQRNTLFFTLQAR